MSINNISPVNDISSGGGYAPTALARSALARSDGTLRWLTPLSLRGHAPLCALARSTVRTSTLRWLAPLARSARSLRWLAPPVRSAGSLRWLAPLVIPLARSAGSLRWPAPLARSALSHSMLARSAGPLHWPAPLARSVQLAQFRWLDPHRLAPLAHSTSSLRWRLAPD